MIRTCRFPQRTADNYEIESHLTYRPSGIVTLEQRDTSHPSSSQVIVDCGGVIDKHRLPPDEV